MKNINLEEIEKMSREDKVKEFRRLDKLVRDLKKNNKEIEKGVMEILRKYRGRIPEWSYEEMDKYDRLEKMNKEVEDEIKKGKKKELAMMTGLLLYNAHQTHRNNNSKDKLNEVVDKGGVDRRVANRVMKAASVTDKSIRDMLKIPWSGMNIYERHDKNVRFTIEKIREVNTQSLMLNDFELAGRRTREEFRKAHNATRQLAISENTFLQNNLTRNTEVYSHVLYIATIDDTTCDICESRHMLPYKIGTEPDLPEHPNCRCWYAPFVDELYKRNEEK